ncbi:Inner membrane protein [Alloactinosynnema sp. L-07]|uniref:nickel/cobalt transporter n=1 Tax=Alloactinosynnema sp. L-07 TaxID=1653480 RepID=UPI00065F087C|nr:nickel transporter [Alloactinosynnema sp. L-07]CRK61985.1 Inner membrane protein [Alloactinosynnema sp. L-07]
MNRTLRRALTLSALTAALSATVFSMSPTAGAHPLGNFTVNHYTGLTVHPHRIDAVAIVDRAEISTAQERPLVDRDDNGVADEAERSAHAHAGCTSLADNLHVDTEASSTRWTISTVSFTYHPGEGGMTTSRLHCALTADVNLRLPADITARTSYDSQRIGWREITARGQGVALTSSTVATTSATDELRHYPQDPLAAPLDQRSATLRVQAGQSSAQTLAPAGPPSTNFIAAILDKISATFTSLVGAREITVPIGLLALLLAIALGASHAAMPGHGKTIIAAYLAGQRGTPRDALTVGATVTLTHTAGVLVLGLVLPIVTTFAGDAILTWLGLASGFLVTVIGLRLLHAALLNRPIHRHHHHRHPHDHHHHRDGTHSHSHSHSHDRHDTAAGLATTHNHAASHTSEAEPASTTRGTLIGMGIAGGLVPSPSALVVLLGAVALGRTAFGVLLIIGYGLGMAATLTLAGLFLIRMRDRIETTTRPAYAALWKRLSRIGPVATSTLVVVVGLGLTLRAFPGGL